MIQKQTATEQQNLEGTLLVYLSSKENRDPITINASSITNHWESMKSKYAWYKPVIGKEEKAKLHFVRKMKKLGLDSFDDFLEGLYLAEEQGLVEEIEELRGKWNLKHYKESSELFDINHGIRFNRKHAQTYSNFPREPIYI